MISWMDILKTLVLVGGMGVLVTFFLLVWLWIDIELF